MTNAIDMMNQEVMVTTLDGRSFTGTMVDVNTAGDVAWIDNGIDWVSVSMNHDKVSLVNPVKEEITIKEPSDVKNITAIKAEYKEELSSQWEDVSYHEVRVFNTEEDNVEVYDAEFAAYSEDGEYLFCVYFGTYYDEKQAVKAAKEMRTKLRKYFEVKGQVYVYTC